MSKKVSQISKECYLCKNKGSIKRKDLPDATNDEFNWIMYLPKGSKIEDIRYTCPVCLGKNG